MADDDSLHCASDVWVTCLSCFAELDKQSPLG
jgi:hypothetical protein